MNLKAFILSLIIARCYSSKNEKLSQHYDDHHSSSTAQQTSSIKDASGTKIKIKELKKKERSMRNRENTESLLWIDLSSSSELTVSSMLYNPTSHVSTWVDNIFGSKAIFYNTKGKIDDAWDKKALSKVELFNRTARFRKVFVLPDYALEPVCSIEVLGFVKISEEGPFYPNLRNQLYVGDASIVIKKRSIDWKCFYRPVTENWRMETKLSLPNFWAVLMFCPAPNAKSCVKLNENISKGNTERKGFIKTNKIDSDFDKGNIILKTPTRDNFRWRAAFEFSFFRSKEHLQNNIKNTSVASIHSSSEDSSSSPKIKSSKVQDAAVCLSIPYTSTDTEKSSANGAMLLEWIRYYTTLGFKVLIYDRDGANEKYIFKSKYGKAQKIIIPKGSLLYHPYTIRGLLDPAKEGAKYDNNESLNTKERQGRYESQGHDKVQTLTHCRFEASSMYGIEDVLVVDFDEFLYCPEADATAEAQGKYLSNYFMDKRNNGLEQIEFAQRVIGNKTDNPRDCVVEKQKRGLSIYDCFGSYRFYNGAHSIKSMHLGHACPLTGYHNACPSETSPRSHDCECSSIRVRSNNRRPYEYWKGRECGVIHLSTNINSYGRKDYIFNTAQKEAIIQSKLELGLVVESV